MTTHMTLNENRVSGLITEPSESEREREGKKRLQNPLEFQRDQNPSPAVYTEMTP